MALSEVEHVENVVKEVTRRAEEYIASLKAQRETPTTSTAAANLSRSALLDATEELQAAVRGPFESVTHKLHLHCALVPVHAAYRFDLPKKVPIDGDISIEKLAQQCDADEDKLRRIIRHGMTRGLFTEPRDGYVAHSPETRALAASDFLMDYVGVMCDDFWPAATQVIPAMQKWKSSQSRKHCGFALTPDAQGGIFDTFSVEPGRASRFDRFMKAFGTSPMYAYDWLCDAYNWNTVNTVVDVGGGSGAQAIVLAERFPSLQITSEDFSALETEASQQIPAHLADRVHFKGHDFFEEQPIRGADIYHFRMIFHDWGNEDCIKIIRALVPALAPASKILIQENLLPPPGALPRSAEWAMRNFDMVMLETNNSLERDLVQWTALFREADPRFAIEDVKQVEGSAYAYIVVGWKGNQA